MKLKLQASVCRSIFTLLACLGSAGLALSQEPDSSDQPSRGAFMKVSDMADDAITSNVGGTSKVGGGCDGCESRTCDACCAGATWIVRADALFLTRSTPDSLVLMQDTTDPSRQLNANAFDFDWRAGWDLSITRSCGGCATEFRYFKIDALNADTTVATNSTTVDPLRINTNPPLFAPDVQTIDALYGSDLESAELNFAMEIGCHWSLLTGLRYVELDEHLHARMDAGAQTFLYDIQTRNRLYGLQLGAVTRDIAWRKFRADASLKAGVFANSGGQGTIFDTGVVTTTATGSSDRAAFLGEIAVAGNYDICDSLSLRPATT